jgi:uncharacterized protein YecE (DUF72 family)
MTRIHAGAVLDRAPGPKYLDTLRFAELQVVGPLPKPSTLRRWGQELPDDFALGLVVPRPAVRSAKGPLRFDEDMEAAFDWTLEAAEALSAKFAIVETGGEVTTGQRDRDLLAAWMERWSSDARLVWHPTGLWDPEIAFPFAKRLGVVWAFDPLEAEPPEASLLYARLRAIGLRNRFGETELLEILDAVAYAGADDAYVAFDSPKSFDEARRLAQLASSMAP